MNQFLRTITALTLLVGLLACAPAPKEVRSGLPPPPERSTRRCPGPQLRCLTPRECSYDRDRGCMVCRCKPGYDPDRKDDQRSDPRWIYDENDR